LFIEQTFNLFNILGKFFQWIWSKCWNIYTAERCGR